jgi:hypothetical protein
LNSYSGSCIVALRVKGFDGGYASKAEVELPILRDQGKRQASRAAATRLWCELHGTRTE